LPSVNRAYSEFKDKGFDVLLVDFREDPATVRKAVRERGYAAPVLLDETGDVTGKAYGVWGPPTVYLLDREGLRHGVDLDGVLRAATFVSTVLGRPLASKVGQAGGWPA